VLGREDGFRPIGSNSTLYFALQSHEKVKKNTDKEGGTVSPGPEKKTESSGNKRGVWPPESNHPSEKGRREGVRWTFFRFRGWDSNFGRKKKS